MKTFRLHIISIFQIPFELDILQLLLLSFRSSDTPFSLSPPPPPTTHTKVSVSPLRCKLCRCKSLWRWRLIQSSKVCSRSFGYRHHVAELAAYPMCLRNTTDRIHVVQHNSRTGRSAILLFIVRLDFKCNLTFEYYIKYTTWWKSS